MPVVPEFDIRWQLVVRALKKQHAIPLQKELAASVFPDAPRSRETKLSYCVTGARPFSSERLGVLLAAIDRRNLLRCVAGLWLAPLDQFKEALLAGKLLDAAELLDALDCEVVPLSQRLAALPDTNTSTAVFQLLKGVRRNSDSMNGFEAAVFQLSSAHQERFEGQLHRFIVESWESKPHRHVVSIAAQILARMTSRGLTHAALDKPIARKIVASPVSVLATGRALCHLAMRHGECDLFIEDIRALIGDPARRHEDHQEQLSFHGGLKEAAWKINEHFVRPGDLKVLDVGRGISVYPLLVQQPGTRDLAMLIKDKMIIAVRELSIGAPLVREVEALMTAREAARYRR